ncbi:MAG: CCA tRNA nucleotidyltransferase [Muribaculaceae bacterium]|nr:CCA tRNA nucleotidyltransferase [Muribaculaceae bacterium]
MTPKNLKEKLTDPVFRTIGETADGMGLEVYVVGGYVRDLLLGRSSADLDFVTVGSGIELARAVSSRLGRKGKLTVYATYGTAQIKHRDRELEFVGARKESYTRNSRNPIVEDGTLDDDQKRRDFTINAMAICLNADRFGDLVDPFGGVADLEAKLIRTPLDPDITFSDDPLRMMRAVRFATQLEFDILPETFEGIRRNAGRISIITKERINDELGKIMRSRRPSIGFMLLDQCGLLERIMPEVYALKGVDTVGGRAHKDNFLHTLQVVDNVAERSDNEWLRWAALLHDIAKPVTKKWDNNLGWTFHNHNFIGERMVPKIFQSMKMPLNDKMKYVQKLVGLHMRPQQVGEEGVSDSGVRRLLTDAGEDVEDLMILAESDLTSRNPVKIRSALDGFMALRERMKEIIAADDYRKWKNPINGHEIMERLGLPPSQEISRLKQVVKDAILDGIIPNDHDAAWDYLVAHMSDSADSLDADDNIIDGVNNK